MIIAAIAAAVAAHEAGHWTAARALGHSARPVLTRRGPGIAWGGPDTSARHRAIVAAAGPAASLALALVAALLGQWWICAASAELGLLNLLPFPHSDGRHALNALNALKAAGPLAGATGSDHPAAR